MRVNRWSNRWSIKKNNKKNNKNKKNKNRAREKTHKNTPNSCTLTVQSRGNEKKNENVRAIFG